MTKDYNKQRAKWAKQAKKRDNEEKEWLKQQHRQAKKQSKEPEKERRRFGYPKEDPR